MYIVMEIQTNQNGAVGTLVSAYEDREQAESKYHTILASAAISDLPVHAAILVTEHGQALNHEAYDHGEE